VTEYELTAIFYQVVDVANASLADFLTITTAMLVVCYLAAAKHARLLRHALVFLSYASQTDAKE
jgi:hypothetical protein